MPALHAPAARAGGLLVAVAALLVPSSVAAVGAAPVGPPARTPTVTTPSGPTRPPAGAARDTCVPGSSQGLTCTATGPTLPNPVALTGLLAPPLRGPDLTGPGDLSVAQFRGRPVLVVFWLNTCPHCRRDLPAINTAAPGLARTARVVTVAIDAGGRGPRGFETPRAATRTLHLAVPTILDTESSSLLSGSGPPHWEVVQTPTAFVVGSNGVIAKVIQPNGAGELTVAALRRALRGVS